MNGECVSLFKGLIQNKRSDKDEGSSRNENSKDWGITNNGMLAGVLYI